MEEMTSKSGGEWRESVAWDNMAKSRAGREKDCGPGVTEFVISVYLLDNENFIVAIAVVLLTLRWKGELSAPLP